MIHRDLKPENILCSQGRYKISDLGYARMLEATELSKTFLGTPLYAAPEILTSKPYDSKVDIWSLGIIFYRMVFNRHPFDFKTNFPPVMYGTI